MGYIIITNESNKRPTVLNQYCEKLKYYDKIFFKGLNKITHPCDRIIAAEQRKQYVSLLLTRFSDKCLMEYTENELDIFESRVRQILGKQNMIHDYFCKPIVNLETWSYIEIILENEWKKKAAEFFFDHGLDYLGLSNCFELTMQDCEVLIVRRID